MNKYIKLEDILDLAEKGILISNKNYDKVCKAIKDLPTIQSEEVVCKFDEDQMQEIINTALEEVIVRCEDCKYWVGDSEWYEDREYKRCQNGGMFTAPNHYCAWGERIEE